MWKTLQGKSITVIRRTTGETPQRSDIMIDLGCQFRVLNSVRKTGRLSVVHGRCGPDGTGGNGQIRSFLICQNESLTHSSLYCNENTCNLNYSYLLHPEKALSFHSVLLHFNLFRFCAMERASITALPICHYLRSSYRYVVPN